MDGLDAIRELRAWEKEHRSHLQQYVVGISAHASTNDFEKGIALGMNTFQSKPLRLKDLQRIANEPDVLQLTARLDALFNSNNDTKRRNNSEHQAVLVVTADVATQYVVISTIEEMGWKAVSVSELKTDFVEKLKSRQWNAVILDDDWPEWRSCVVNFRAWESQNRVRKQLHFVHITSQEHSSSVRHASAFSSTDCIYLHKPVTRPAIEHILRLKESMDDDGNFSAEDIITR